MASGSGTIGVGHTCQGGIDSPVNKSGPIVGAIAGTLIFEQVHYPKHHELKHIDNEDAPQVFFEPQGMTITSSAMTYSTTSGVLWNWDQPGDVQLHDFLQRRFRSGD